MLEASFTIIAYKCALTKHFEHTTEKHWRYYRCCAKWKVYKMHH